MPVLNFSYARIHDADKFHQYVNQAAPLLAAHGVEVVVRARFAETLRGASPEAQVAAVFRHRDIESAIAFYACERYRALVPLRDEACEMTVQLYQE